MAAAATVTMDSRPQRMNEVLGEDSGKSGGGGLSQGKQCVVSLVHYMLVLMVALVAVPGSNAQDLTPPSAVKMSYFEFNYGFEPGMARDPTVEELDAMLCFTNDYILERVAAQLATSGDNKPIKMRNWYINWAFDETQDLPVKLNFHADVRYADDSDIVEKFKVHNSFELTAEDVGEYITDYVWNVDVYNIFYYAMKVDYKTRLTEPVGDIFRLERSYCGEPRPASSLPEPDRQVALPGILDPELAPPAIKMVYFELAYGFEPGLAADPTVEELDDMLCFTNDYILDRVAAQLATLGDNKSIKMRNWYINWEFDETQQLPLKLNFHADVRYSDDSDIIEKHMVHNSFELTKEDIHDYIKNYVWKVDVDNIFYYAMKVNYKVYLTESTSDIFKLERSYCGEPRPASSLPEPNRQVALPGMLDPELAPAAVKMAYFVFHYGFEPGLARDPTVEEVDAMICFSNDYILERVAAQLATSGDNKPIKMRNWYINWAFDETQDLPVKLNFHADVRYADDSDIVEKHMVLNSFESIEGGIADYIKNYVWNVDDDNIFYYTLGVRYRVSLTEPIGDIFKLERSYCGEPRPPTSAIMAGIPSPSPDLSSDNAGASIPPVVGPNPGNTATSAASPESTHDALGGVSSAPPPDPSNDPVSSGVPIPPIINLALGSVPPPASSPASPDNPGPARLSRLPPQGSSTPSAASPGSTSTSSPNPVGLTPGSTTPSVASPASANTPGSGSLSRPSPSSATPPGPTTTGTNASVSRPSPADTTRVSTSPPAASSGTDASVSRPSPSSTTPPGPTNTPGSGSLSRPSPSSATPPGPTTTGTNASVSRPSPADTTRVSTSPPAASSGTDASVSRPSPSSTTPPGPTNTPGSGSLSRPSPSSATPPGPTTTGTNASVSQPSPADTSFVPVSRPPSVDPTQVRTSSSFGMSSGEPLDLPVMDLPVNVFFTVSNLKHITLPAEVNRSGLGDAFPEFVLGLLDDLQKTPAAGETRNLLYPKDVDDIQRVQVELEQVKFTYVLDSAHVRAIKRIDCHKNANPLLICHEVHAGYNMEARRLEHPEHQRRRLEEADQIGQLDHWQSLFAKATDEAIRDGKLQSVMMERRPDSPLIIAASAPTSKGSKSKSGLRSYIESLPWPILGSVLSALALCCTCLVFWGKSEVQQEQRKQAMLGSGNAALEEGNDWETDWETADTLTHLDDHTLRLKCDPLKESDEFFVFEDDEEDDDDDSKDCLFVDISEFLRANDDMREEGHAETGCEEDTELGYTTKNSGDNNAGVAASPATPTEDDPDRNNGIARAA